MAGLTLREAAVAGELDGLLREASERIAASDRNGAIVTYQKALEIAPEEPDAEVAAAGRALGQALSGALHDSAARGHGSAVVPADEALAHVALEASGRPLLVSNVDLSDMGVGGLATDLVARFLSELAEGAGLTLHVRLIEGRDTQHVLEAIFKGLGVALCQAVRSRRKETDG